MDGTQPKTRLPILAFVLLLGSAIAMTWAGRNGWLEGQGDLTSNNSINAAQRLLSFNDADNGSVEVWDATNQQLLHTIASGEGSFVRGILRSLTRERRLRGISSDAPFALRTDKQQHLLLEDTATGTTLILNAYGPNNVASFAHYLPQAPQES